MTAAIEVFGWLLDISLAFIFGWMACEIRHTWDSGRRGR